MRRRTAIVWIVVGMLMVAMVAVAQTDFTVSVTLGAKRLARLKDALTAIEARAAAPMPVDDAYVTQWIKEQVAIAVKAAIDAADRAEARPGGALDLSDLSAAQRAQVKALIASFKQ